jgi:ATP-binding cassette subfamily B multidrug efflux pump
VVETGTHAELLAQGGLYEKLWRHQSGGFLADRLVDGFESDEVAAER